MDKKWLLTTKEVADFLNINEKMVYSLIAEKGLPATKVTGKWLFPRHLVEKWIEKNTVNYPHGPETGEKGLIILCGSNDILMERALSTFNEKHEDYLCVFANLGSMGGIYALERHRCHIALSHLMGSTTQDYNFDFLKEHFSHLPAVINFCMRRQGMLLKRGNPHNISSLRDIASKDIRLVNRKKGTGTRVLLEKRLMEEDIDPSSIQGYGDVVNSHLEVGLRICRGEADVGIGIEAVAHLLGLDFIPWVWERFDLIIPRHFFFQKNIQAFLGFLMEKDFRDLASGLKGYDLSLTGRMVFPSS